MADYLPYLAEYAKSGRSSCKKCKEKIPQDCLRLAVVYQSSKFDGKMTSWYHFDCFFERQRPKAVGDIEHFDQLRWDDQEKITKKIESLALLGAVAKPAPKKGRGKAAASSAKGGELLDYSVEYAKSGRAACRGCLEKIEKDEVRMSKKNYDAEATKGRGPIDEWYHTKCFKGKREELGLSNSIESVPGFNSLSADDKKRLLKDFPAMTANKKHKMEPDTVDGASDAKRVKKEVDKEEEAQKDELKKQNKILYKYRDELGRLSKPELQALIEFNDQQPPTGKSELLDFVADLMTFGALVPCSECKTGQFFYKSGVGYICSGNMTEWTKCPNTTTSPARKPFKVPPEFGEDYDFLNKYKFVERKRIIPALKVTVPASKSEDVKQEAKPVPKGPPLKGLTFVLDSNLDKEIKKDVEKLGGKVGSRITAKVTAYIATKEQVKAMDSKMEKVKELRLPVVPPDFIEEVRAGNTSTAAFLLLKKNLASWECPDAEKLLKDETAASAKSGSKSTGEKSGKSMPEKMKLTLKGGGVVDPESELDHKTHVLKTKDTMYSVVLGIVDIQAGRNSYYKLQVLEHDKHKKWYLFRSWGRVGTTIGDKKLTTHHDKQAAIEEFVGLYEEKTGNTWKNRKNFVKHPGKLYPLDIDYGDADTHSKLSADQSKSKLAKPVQELICMLFDIEMMKRAMVEFELDLTKMPLGKLSKKQLEKAYGILGQAQQLLDIKDTHEAKFIDISNQFYTLIPHDFGRKSPPILNDSELIKNKLEMLESLMEIEVAFNLLKAGDEVKDKDPIDAHYEKLDTKIEVLDKSSEEYALLAEYARNTHASTHTQYTLELEEVFKVVRKNEASRFKPFSKLPNRRLLWHGSRVANMAGILSQGLRIAPPEAPVTGYMFGKGIYFADMISKSANYCVTSKSNPAGLLLLCDVALGNCYERKEADYIEKLKKGYHSVRGIGKTEPDPKSSKMMDQVQIPLGKPVATNVKDTTLLYNEFIVYDVAQVNIKYLLKTKFHYK